MKSSIEVYRLSPVSGKKIFREIAQIHQEEITEGFLSTLGIDFLEKLYRFIASSRHAFIFVAASEGQVRGFICGCTNTSRLYKEFILRNAWQMLSTILPKIFSFETILRIKETLWYPQKKECQELPSSEILNFCVSGKYKRQGVGKLLFKHLIQQFKQLKIDKIKIITGEEQISAQRFYESMKAKKISNISIHNGTLSNVFIFNIL